MIDIAELSPWRQIERQIANGEHPSAKDLAFAGSCEASPEHLREYVALRISGQIRASRRGRPRIVEAEQIALHQTVLLSVNSLLAWKKIVKRRPDCIRALAASGEISNGIIELGRLPYDGILAAAAKDLIMAPETLRTHLKAARRDRRLGRVFQSVPSVAELEALFDAVVEQKSRVKKSMN